MLDWPTLSFSITLPSTSLRTHLEHQHQAFAEQQLRCRYPEVDSLSSSSACHNAITILPWSHIVNTRGCWKDDVPYPKIILPWLVQNPLSTSSNDDWVCVCAPASKFPREQWLNNSRTTVHFWISNFKSSHTSPKCCGSGADKTIAALSLRNWPGASLKYSEHPSRLQGPRPPACIIMDKRDASMHIWPSEGR